MRRRACTVALALAAIAAPGAARADADPASDTLYTNDVFLPLSARVSPTLARRLADVASAASAAGKPVRVALIAAPADLGGVPTLFGKPTDYARFLDAELQFVYSGKLLVVMPQGAGLAEHGRLEANASVVHAVIGSGADGLARTAIALVRALSGHEPEPKPAPASPPPQQARHRSSRRAAPAPSPPASVAASARGFPVWESAVIATGAVGAFVLGGLLFVRRRLRSRPLDAMAASEVVPDPNDPYRYRGP